MKPLLLTIEILTKDHIPIARLPTIAELILLGIIEIIIPSLRDANIIIDGGLLEFSLLQV
jgi:hypothetical protein